MSERTSTSSQNQDNSYKSSASLMPLDPAYSAEASFLAKKYADYTAAKVEEAVRNSERLEALGDTSIRVFITEEPGTTALIQSHDGAEQLPDDSSSV